MTVSSLSLLAPVLGFACLWHVTKIARRRSEFHVSRTLILLAGCLLCAFPFIVYFILSLSHPSLLGVFLFFGAWFAVFLSPRFVLWIRRLIYGQAHQWEKP